ncbi:MAG: hypothetical protein LBC60_06750 [Spirochaetaceae bacterium]|jgi:hypothetical protein|nr:hypothetical protein [Spirochaetaceae bacterium]
MNRKFLLIPVLLAAFTIPLVSQDFGFGDEDADTTTVSSGVPAVTISGEVSASLLGYVDDFSGGLAETGLGDIFSGKLNFSAGNSFGDAVIKLKLSPISSPVTIDEAYLCAYFGVFEIEGGLRKLTWGKADSFGPLDVINPLDYTEITDVSDTLNMKIARPLVHGTIRTGQFSKLEAVFVPVFKPHSMASGGRWASVKMTALPIPPVYPDTSTLDYAQGGFRFTTTLGSSDLGVQYYFGRFPQPAFKVNITPGGSAAVEARYNPYHQIGVDYAGIIAGFNLRAEFAAHITSDLNGDDGAVYNPYLAWSIGFDRDLVWNINLNLQATESIRLLYGKISHNPLLDTEADTDMTATQLTAILSKKFLRDELELRLATLWEIEARDFFIMPGIIWTKDAVSVEFSGGIFGGDREGTFGQYRKNTFLKAGLTYSF